MTLRSARATASQIEVVPTPEESPEHEPLFYLQVNEAQCTELSFGRVPGEVQEMAKTLVDWTYEDLRKNAAKPIRKARR